MALLEAGGGELEGDVADVEREGGEGVVLGLDFRLGNEGGRRLRFGGRLRFGFRFGRRLRLGLRFGGAFVFDDLVDEIELVLGVADDEGRPVLGM